MRDQGWNLTPEVIASAAVFSAALLHEAAGQRGALPPYVHAVSPSFKLCGPALPVRAPDTDNLWIHRAIYKAREGDIVVVDTAGSSQAGFWGEIMTQAALVRKLGGAVIDGYVRDSREIQRLGFPIFARGFFIRGTSKNPHTDGSVAETVQIGGIDIACGDLIVGDADGVVVIPKSEVSRTIEQASALRKKEAGMIEAIRAGKTTLQLLGLADA